MVVLNMKSATSDMKNALVITDRNVVNLTAFRKTIGLKVVPLFFSCIFFVKIDMMKDTLITCLFNNAHIFCLYPCFFLILSHRSLSMNPLRLTTMKKILLLLIAVVLPLFLQAQVAMTLDQMSETQIDRILNASKKVVLHCVRITEQGQSTQMPHETFTLIYDYPNGGCDFYVKGEKYAYFLSRPMNAQKKYINEERDHMLAYKFNATDKNYLAFIIFTHEGSMQFPQMTWYVNDEGFNSYTISSIDFYDTSDHLIASSYAPLSASDIDTGNLWQCWMEKVYQRYR